MNFAEAIRQASSNQAPRRSEGVVEPTAFTEAACAAEPKMENTNDVKVATDAVTAQPVPMPEPPQISTGSVVRLELFLNPEQLSNLFRAVSATQHSMMTLRETASYLRVNAGVLEQMAQDGEIPAFNIDGRWRFPKHGIDEWLTIQAFNKESA
ncbi:MAG: helix-turn-helix domain-containing protein [Fimbriimonadales bacterium]